MDALTRYVDPLSAAVGGLAAGASWAIGVPAVVGMAIGGLTFVIASAGAALMRSRARSIGAAAESDASHVVQLHAHEERWMRRADDAVSAIDRCVDWLDGGPLKDRLGQVAVQAREVLEDLYALASQAASTRAAGHQLDAARLTSDLTRLTAKLDGSADLDVEEDLRRSLEAVREQLSIYRRFEAARRVLQARIESGSLGLQQLAAQVSEMTALADPERFVHQGRRIDELSTQLETLRSGLSDADALSRRTLGQTDTDTEGGTS